MAVEPTGLAGLYQKTSWSTSNTQWRKPKHPEKFYTGIAESGPIDADTLWRARVNTEDSVVSDNPVPVSKGPSSKHPNGLKMSAAGFLYCEEDISSARSQIRSSRSQMTSRSRAGSSASLVSSGKSTFRSSVSNNKYSQVRDMIRQEAQAMQQIATSQIDALRDALDNERVRREAAEDKIKELSSMLNVKSEGA